MPAERRGSVSAGPAESMSTSGGENGELRTFRSSEDREGNATEVRNSLMFSAEG